MAKFCTKCGKELKNGKACTCEKEVKKETKKETEKKEVATTTTNIDIKESLMDCVNALKNIFIKPFEAVKEFVTDNKLISGIIMILVAAISTGLYKIATIKNMYSASSSNSFNVNDFVNILSGNSSYGTKPDYLKEFFTEAGTNLLIYALIALFGYLIVTKLLKGKSTWKQMVTAVAISLSVVLVGCLINSILVFIDAEVIGYIRGYITSFAYILSILILYIGVKETAEIDKNKLFLSVASMSVCATVVWDIIDKIFD